MIDPNGYHLLYVEDEEKIRNSMARAFRAAGYNVTVCSCIMQVRNTLVAWLFDVVVSDWNLGEGGNGGQVYDLVTTAQPDLAKRFLFVSGDRPSIAHHVPWLEKPVAPNQVLKTLDELIFTAHRCQTDVRGSAS